MKLHVRLLELNLHLRATQRKVKRELKPTRFGKIDSIPTFQDVAEVFVQQSEVFLSNWLLMLSLSLYAVILILLDYVSSTRLLA